MDPVLIWQQWQHIWQLQQKLEIAILYDERNRSQIQHLKNKDTADINQSMNTQTVSNDHLRQSWVKG